MLRRYLRRVLPTPSRLREEGVIRLFGRALQNPDLWHLNRHSVATAVSVGLFTAFMPVPVQMLLAAAGAVLLGCNLPISVVVVWVSNPITMPPLFFAAYKFGAWLLHETPRVVHFEMSIEWFFTRLTDIWQPFLLGCFVLGLATAAVGYVTVQVIWRIHVIQSWKERRRRRLETRRNVSHPPPHRSAVPSEKESCV